MELLKALITVSEKAANIARLCRQNQHLFQLLIEEKKPDEANPRFLQDFKTLADVLIQEVVKHEIGQKFPVIREAIQGEENNTFSNTLGETIKVEIKSTPKETADLLRIVLNGDEEAAELLSLEVHREIDFKQIKCQELIDCKIANLSELGIWIDPIDSTAEYISGIEETRREISISGLRCVTVLIGAFNQETGEPIMGVVNQPFVHQNSNGTWSGCCFWGIPHFASVSSGVSPSKTRICVVSSSENQNIIKRLQDYGGFEIVEASGAGYKILTVIQSLADAYVLTKNSTFKWDTCGPQAILGAQGGGVVVYDEAVKNNHVVGVSYRGGAGGSKCNEGGIIAYRDPGVLDDIIKCLKAV